MMTKKIKNTGIMIILFILVAFTWGSTWMAMKIAISTIPPIYATGLRFLVASPLLIVLSYFNRSPLLFPKGSRVFQFLICIAYFAIPFTLMIYGERSVNSALAAIIFANMPIAVLVISFLLLGERISFLQLLGLILGVGSLSSILWLESTHSEETWWPGVLSLLIAMLMHAIMYVLCKNSRQQVSVLTYNTLPCLGAGILLLCFGYFIETPDINLFSVRSLSAVIYLGIIGGVLGILAYFSLQKYASTFQASLVFLIFPLIAIGVEKIVNNTTINHVSLLFMLPLLIGISMLLYNKQSAK